MSSLSVTSIRSSMRPGITADYAPLPSAPVGAGKAVGIIAHAPLCGAVSTPAMDCFSNYSDAVQKFGASPLSDMIKAVFDNAACDIYAVRVNAGDAAQYRAALELLASAPAVYGIVGGNPDAGLLQYAAELLADGSGGGGKLYFSACPDVGSAAVLAEQINCERVILAAPAVHPTGEAAGTDVSAALLAAITARQKSPASNLFGEEVLGDYAIGAPLTEATLNDLLRRGVTVFEQGTLCPEIVRGVTTRTRSSEGTVDYSLRNISAPCTVDYVTETLKASLSRRLAAGGPTGGMDIGSVAAAAEWELLQLTESGLLSAYEKPTVTPDKLDPSVCDVGIAFTIRQGVAQIFLHIRYE